MGRMWIGSDSFGIDVVIFCVCPYETNVYRSETVFDFGYKPVGISRDIEYNSIVGQKVSTSEQLFHVRRRCPV